MIKTGFEIMREIVLEVKVPTQIPIKVPKVTSSKIEDEDENNNDINCNYDKKEILKEQDKITCKKDIINIDVVSVEATNNNGENDEIQDKKKLVRFDIKFDLNKI